MLFRSIGATTQKYVQQSFSIPTHIRNMDKMDLQCKEYTVMPKPHGENELTIQGKHCITKTTWRK